jgi:hypothetical protein
MKNHNLKIRILSSSAPEDNLFEVENIMIFYIENGHDELMGIHFSPVAL